MSARAQFYPNVNLSAFIGVQSLGIDMLKERVRDIGSVGPAISLPIFNGGRLHGQLRGADAEYAEAVANYDAAPGPGAAGSGRRRRAADARSPPQIDRIGAAVDAAREAWRMQNDRYQGGLATYLDVLSAEDYLLTQPAHPVGSAEPLDGPGCRPGARPRRRLSSTSIN